MKSADQEKDRQLGIEERLKTQLDYLDSKSQLEEEEKKADSADLKFSWKQYFNLSGFTLALFFVSSSIAYLIGNKVKIEIFFIELSLIVGLLLLIGFTFNLFPCWNFHRLKTVLIVLTGIFVLVMKIGIAPTVTFLLFLLQEIFNNLNFLWYLFMFGFKLI